MKFKAKKIVYHLTEGYTVLYKEWYWPFWRQFLHGVNEGGGRYFIFENSVEDALRRLAEVTHITRLPETTKTLYAPIKQDWERLLVNKVITDVTWDGDSIAGFTVAGNFERKYISIKGTISIQNDSSSNKYTTAIKDSE